MRMPTTKDENIHHATKSTNTAKGRLIASCLGDFRSECAALSSPPHLPPPRPPLLLAWATSDQSALHLVVLLIFLFLVLLFFLLIVLIRVRVIILIAIEEEEEEDEEEEEEEDE